MIPAEGSAAVGRYVTPGPRLQVPFYAEAVGEDLPESLPTNDPADRPGKLAAMAELVDATVLGTVGQPWGFESL
jgi:hypothetical protein